MGDGGRVATTPTRKVTLASDIGLNSRDLDQVIVGIVLIGVA